jgi:hypothetical protein
MAGGPAFRWQITQWVPHPSRLFAKGGWQDRSHHGLRLSRRVSSSLLRDLPLFRHQLPQRPINSRLVASSLPWNHAPCQNVGIQTQRHCLLDRPVVSQPLRSRSGGSFRPPVEACNRATFPRLLTRFRCLIWRVAQPSDGKPHSGCPILRGFLRRVGGSLIAPWTSPFPPRVQLTSPRSSSLPTSTSAAPD